MSSTYAHYQGPASLPSDYAILSRYSTGSQPELDTAIQSEDEGSNSENASDYITSRSTSPRRSSFPATYLRPPNPTMDGRRSSTRYSIPKNPSLDPTETSPLLSPLVPRIEENILQTDTENDLSKMAMFWQELRILMRYAWPVFGSVLTFHLPIIHRSQLSFVGRTHLLEYSLVVVSVISIGHLSTTALAAITLGSMTASVSGFSVIQGFTSALDTMLPSAWTSSQPQYVGLWAQRMCLSNSLSSFFSTTKFSCTLGVVMAVSLIVSIRPVADASRSPAHKTPFRPFSQCSLCGSTQRTSSCSSNKNPKWPGWPRSIYVGSP